MVQKSGVVDPLPFCRYLARHAALGIDGSANGRRFDTGPDSTMRFGRRMQSAPTVISHNRRVDRDSKV
jgi:hypothetical protein